MGCTNSNTDKSRPDHPFTTTIEGCEGTFLPKGNQYNGYQPIYTGISTLNSFVPSPNGRFIAIGYAKNIVKLYDFQEMKFLQTYEGCTWSQTGQAIINPAFSPDSELMAFRWEHKVRIVSTSTLQMVHEYDNGSDVLEIHFSPNGQYLAIGSWADKVNIYKVGVDSATAMIGSIEARTQQGVFISQERQIRIQIVPRWTPDSQHILTRWNDDVNINQVSENGVSNVGKLGPNKLSGHGIFDISISPDGSRVIVGGQYKANMWDFNSKQALNTNLKSCSFSVRNEMNLHNAWSDNGEFYAIRWDKQVIVYSAHLDKVFAKFDLPWYPLFMKFSPDSSKISFGTNIETFVANIQSQQITHKFKCKSYDVWAVQTLPPHWIGNDTVIGRVDLPNGRSDAAIWKVTMQSAQGTPLN